VNLNAALGQLAAQLVVDGCIPLSDEKPLRGKSAAEGAPVSKEARAQLNIEGASPDGNTLFFALGGNGVFWDLSYGLATVWFKGGDPADALKELERSLKKAYPKYKFIEEQRHPDDKDLRVRFYIVDLTPPKLVSLEVSHTVANARAPQFTVRVRPLKEPN
jgi:hypothetical protein